MTEVLGRRELRKAQTRRRLSEEAFALFLAHGFDQVTVADVAASAGVSVTTLFSYFPTKESLVFDPEGHQLDALVLAVRTRPVGVSLVDAVERHTYDALDTMADEPVRRAYAALVAATPSLQRHIQTVMLTDWRPVLRAALHETVWDLDPTAADVAAVHLLGSLAGVAIEADAEAAARFLGPLRHGYGAVGA
ncbi:TetR family transcriptional regulator [Lapillicoccus jejuensis]|uniref:TetR family transcriptional regulator n=1 Tax=Lapillicoccus jejuensis TaxID=402171 RepID=A0A542E4X5_9MICO|nr:TetR family transcriptional regulator [Lapillicoccus jejuensis]TQJ10391.1 TetR family transcriptional regulator [Lapillicoccus jejuensis]